MLVTTKWHHQVAHSFWKRPLDGEQRFKKSKRTNMIWIVSAKELKITVGGVLEVSN